MGISNLTKEEARSVFDYKDGVLLWRPRHGGKWDKRWAGKPAGRKKLRPDGRSDVSVNWQSIKYHRAVWNWWMGHIPDGYQIDHINGDPSDNRIENLRMCLPEENGLNKKIQSNSKTGYKNIYFDKSRNCWTVRVKNKKEKYFERFKTLEEAQIAAYNARVKLHGKFACHGQRDVEVLNG